MIVYKGVSTDEEIQQVLDLQKNNLPQNLTPDQIASQGFVTVVHSFDLLKTMNSIEQSMIATENGRVIGYLLAMTNKSRNEIPVLFPMFQVFDNAVYNNKKISEYKYIVVGQVCIDKAWRGRGILDDCYTAYRKHFMSRYDFAITEIHATNMRSITAHIRIGFSIIHSYTDSSGNTWKIVLWDWRDENARQDAGCKQ